MTHNVQIVRCVQAGRLEPRQGLFQEVVVPHHQSIRPFAGAPVQQQLDAVAHGIGHLEWQRQPPVWMRRHPPRGAAAGDG